MTRKAIVPHAKHAPKIPRLEVVAFRVPLRDLVALNALSRRHQKRRSTLLREAIALGIAQIEARAA